MTHFKNLPEDIIQRVFSYDNVFRYRTGKFIGRIAKNDPRKAMIQNIARPEIYTSSWSQFVKNRQCFSIKLGKHNGLHRYHLHFHPDKIIVYVCDQRTCVLSSHHVRF
jgi:hypothetical protein